MGKKIILLEVNEVPYRVIDEYCRIRPDSVLHRMLSMSDQYETFTEDQFALDPWISWPTLHRGVNDEIHNILHLGQVDEEADSAYPPIWRLLHERGLSVGVFGSLHSSNVPVDYSSYEFYLPDYFGNRSFAHPPALQSFQDLNLRMTRDSARNVSRKIPLAAAAKFALTARRLGLRFSTITDLVTHLVRETMNSALRIRRRVYQPVVMMDLFISQLSRSKPQFASFYTNHVAAAMHRYWAAAFPEDYKSGELDQSWTQRYREEIWFAMDKLDCMLSSLKRFVDANPEYTVMFASSMGQAAIPAKKTYEFLTITDIDKFMSSLGVPSHAWEARPAMVPCSCVVVAESHRESFARSVQSLVIGEAQSQSSKKPVAPMSFDQRANGFFQIFIQFDNFKGQDVAYLQGERVAFSDLGLGKMAHEDGVNCTAQHVAGGSLFVYPVTGSQSAKNARDKISTLDVVPSILRLYGYQKPGYMRGEARIALDMPMGHAVSDELRAAS